MAESIMDQVVANLRENAARYYPHHADLRNVRVVGHTPKSDHYIYDIVIDFSDGSERTAAKVYRSKAAGKARDLATAELKNLQFAYEIAERKNLTGIPRPLGDFAQNGVVVAEKLNGLPLQSIVMKAALLPGYADHGLLTVAARFTGDWLKRFHHATQEPAIPFDGDALQKDLEKLCTNCKGEGLDDASIDLILSGTKAILSKSKKTLPASAVLCDFTPLNVLVSEQGIGIAEYAKLERKGYSYLDVAHFMACVEALEKYPFCDRDLIGEVQAAFLDAYEVSEADEQLLRVFKMKSLLTMFAAGRNIKESALRKRVMWATVMKRFIHQAAQRSMAPAA
ncbi:hypothetical protein Acid345_4199 [Candidatus Koribacter versatilis Ellin345]|uniref:Aminoglycoside phosphotransferase domain-containing protein n=1 Tax=Koribacter versatilis (strain Ellin345) TaxID=204669 RepID=Q1IIV1_KORVE|nr:hypothetical protein [Candidatus Koribacter versatilis]ABF43199.1 hypothetical protein Acid345_4199 [Candidatus Koribacter versatilis Ellin345]